MAMTRQEKLERKRLREQVQSLAWDIVGHDAQQNNFNILPRNVLIARQAIADNDYERAEQAIDAFDFFVLDEEWQP